jgi:hypothetical protein
MALRVRTSTDENIPRDRPLAKAKPSQPLAEEGARPHEYVRVIVRVAPPAAPGVAASVVAQPERRRLVLERPFYDARAFEADCILAAEASQADAYEMIGAAAVRDVLRGFNSTVILFGQSGSGKTHTAFGRIEGGQNTEDDIDGGAGLVPRALLELCAAAEHARRAGDWLDVHLSAYEVYCERVVDLLNVGVGPDSTALPSSVRIREDARRGVHLDGLIELEVSADSQRALALLRTALRHRAVGATGVNARSSRSHAVVLLRARSSSGGGALLTVADLAGSERCAKSGCDGARLAEAKSINRSISALGNCISALADAAHAPHRHIPFRDSTITRLLTDAIGGNSRTCVCATLSPALSAYDENVSTMLFASRARAVRTAAEPNRTPRGGALPSARARPAAIAAREAGRLADAAADVGADDQPLDAHYLAAQPRVAEPLACLQRPPPQDEPPLSAEDEHDLVLIRRLRAAMARDAFLAKASARDDAHVQRVRAWVQDGDREERTT